MQDNAKKQEKKETGDQVNTKGHKKGEHKERRQKKEHVKDEYDYNAEIINQNTVIPAKPLKNEIISKPNIDDYKKKEALNKEKLLKMFEKKNLLKAQNFSYAKKAKGGEGDSKHSAFKNEVSQIKELREKWSEVRNERNSYRQTFKKLINEAKANNEKIKQYRESLKGSREFFNERLQKLEHRLYTADISKEEEKELNNEIMLLNRKIKDAHSSGNIEIMLEQCQQRKDELSEQIDRVKEEKQPYEKEHDQMKTLVESKDKQIKGIKEEITTQSKEKTEENSKRQTEWQKWKDEKKKRVAKVDDEIDKVKAENHKIWDDYYDRQDKYWKQKRLIDFIQWQTKVRTRKINAIERQARKKEDEEKDKLRDKQYQMKKYLGQIELCNFLINYLNNIKQDKAEASNKKEEQIKKEVDVGSKLATDSQWKKEKGLEVLQSKKSKEDEEPEKKQKKNKKNKQKVVVEEKKFSIPYNVEAMFQGLKLLPPANESQIDSKINELRERQSLFEKVCKEESNEQEKKLAEQIKQKKQKKHAKQGKKNGEEEDFPSI